MKVMRRREVEEEDRGHTCSCWFRHRTNRSWSLGDLVQKTMEFLSELQKEGWNVSWDSLESLLEDGNKAVLSTKAKLLAFLLDVRAFHLDSSPDGGNVAGLQTDLKEYGIPILEEHLDRQAGTLRGPIVLQISKVSSEALEEGCGKERGGV